MNHPAHHVPGTFHRLDSNAFQAPPWAVTLFALLSVVLLPALAAADVPAPPHLANATSETMRRPAIAKATDLELKPGTYSARFGEVEGYIDVVGSTAWVWAPLSPMSAAPLVEGIEATDDRMDVDRTDGATRVRANGVAYHLDAAGCLSAVLGETAIDLTLPLAGEVDVAYRGAGLVVLTSGPWRIEIFRSGLASVSTQQAASLALPADAYLEQSRRADYGIVREPDGQPLVFGQDWLRLSRGEVGLVAMPEAGTQMRVDGATLNLEGKAPKVWLAAASTKAQAFDARAAMHASVLLVAGGSGFVGELTLDGRTAGITVIDRDGNGRPDLAADAWLFDVGQDASPELAITFLPQSRDANIGRRVHVFALDGKNPADVKLLEWPPADGGKGESAYASIGMAEPGQTPRDDGETVPTLAPTLVAEDFNQDGAFWQGSVFAGGFVGADRFSTGHDEWSVAWDFGGDGLPDVWQFKRSQYLFNYFNEMTSLFDIDLDVTAGRIDVNRRKGYDLQKAGSMFSKTCLAGRLYKGAVQAFEEHFFLDISPDRFPTQLPNGGNLFYYTIRGDVSRITMGRLAGSTDLRAWNIELDPITDPDEVDWQLREWRTPNGHVLKLNTFSGPEQWDGRALGLRGALAGWYAMADGRFKTLGMRATFAPPGSPSGSSEGMYGGALSTQERIEMDTDGGSYTLYFSPLMGDLHLKGADFGSYAIPAGTEDFWLDINRYYHREAHVGSRLYVGAEPTQRWIRREGKRLEGPVFLSYRDLDGDGYFDNYVYDQDNDGLFERMLRYEPKANVLTLIDRTHLAAWPAEIRFEEVRYLPENYDAISKLHRRAFRQPPMVVRTTLPSSGTPVEVVTAPVFREQRPEFFLSFAEGWQCRVAADVGHRPEGTGGWDDFSPAGLSRLGTIFVQNGMTQTTLAEPWSATSLADIDVLVVAGLSRTPTPTEFDALQTWLADGGVLMLSCPADPAQRLRFQAVGSVLGFDLASEPQDRQAPIFRYASMGPINDPRTRAAIHRKPGPWNAASRFSDPQELNLFEGVQSLSYVAYPLRDMKGFSPLLRSEDAVLMGDRRIGEGRVILSGADWFANRYIWHHEYFQNTDNDVLLENLLASLTASLPVMRVDSIRRDATGVQAVLSGKGGRVRFPRRYQAAATDLARIGQRTQLAVKQTLSRVLVNGEPVAVIGEGVLWGVDVPAGEVTLEIRYETVEATTPEESR